MNRIIIHIFKILAVMVISLLCWSFFIGSPDTTRNSDTSTVTTASYAARGSQFEAWTYGERAADGSATGMRLASARTWLRDTNVNGQLSRVWTEDIWEAAETGSVSNNHILYWEGC